MSVQQRFAGAMQLRVMRGVLAGKPPAIQAQIRAAEQAVASTMLAHGSAGLMALALLSAEISAAGDQPGAIDETLNRIAGS